MNKENSMTTPNEITNIVKAARELMDTELADMACTGSDAPVEHALGMLADALACYPTPVAQEPVAFMCTHHASGVVRFLSFKRMADAYSPSDWKITLLYAAPVAAQAIDNQIPIDMERLRHWLSKYGHSTTESLEEMGAQANRWVNRLLRMEPFQKSSGQDREDAERYRWLRGAGVDCSTDIDVVGFDGECLNHEELDAAIDAARKTKGEA